MTNQNILTLLKKDIQEHFGGNEWKEFQFSEHFFSNIKESYFPIQQEISFLKSKLKSGSILDLGCGNFRLIKDLKDAYYCIGVDFSFYPLRSKLSPSLCADYNKLPIKKRFDNIFLSFGQICFLKKEQLKVLLSQLKKNLKNSGLIYIDLPSLLNFQDLDEYNTFETKEEESIFWSRQYFPNSGIFSQRKLSFDSNGKLKSQLSLSYQTYALSELILLFEELGFHLKYAAEDFNNNPIKEESQWMIFLISKN